MKYCMECGQRLELKLLEKEGMIPFCKTCGQFRFPVYSTAISVVILNKERNKTLFIQQYGKKRNILVAGYINKGEAAEEAVYREMQEEIGIKPVFIKFQKSSYWSKSNTLVLNYYAIIEEERLNVNDEVDSYAWFSFEEALDMVAKGGLAEEFYNYFYKNNRKSIL